MEEAVRQSIRQEYADALAEGRPPRFSQQELAVSVKVAEELLERGELEIAAHAVRGLHEACPDLAWAKTVMELFEIMPAADPDAPRFCDDYPKPLQVVPRQGAETALLVFCGASHRIGMPLTMFHRWLARLPVSLVYLRDLRELCYLGGIKDLGGDLSSTVSALGGLVQDLGARRIVCYGNSVGGYGALRYGLDLAADAVICMGGLINLDAAFNRHLRYANTARTVETAFPEAQFDLRELYRRAEARPRCWLVYGERNWDDRIHARYMTGLDGVTLKQIDGYRGHNGALELIHAGRFDELLQLAMAS